MPAIIKLKAESAKTSDQVITDSDQNREKAERNITALWDNYRSQDGNNWASDTGTDKIKNSILKMQPRLLHDFNRITVHPSSSLTIQPKLAVNAPGDEYEQEADAVADKVMQMPETAATQLNNTAGNALQNKRGNGDEEQVEEKEKEEEQEPVVQEIVQRKYTTGGTDANDDDERYRNKNSGDSAPLVTPNVQQVIQSPGQPLDNDTRYFMEARFGFDFSKVQIHNNALAHQSAKDISAQAYTHQNHIAFGEDQYQPQTSSGKKLLAHELMHTVQQGASVKRKPALIKKQKERTTKFGMSELAVSKATVFAQAHVSSGLKAFNMVQRRISHGVNVSRMQFSPKELPADGATTSQAKVHTSKSAAIIWRIDGDAFGSVIDAKGLITPGAAITRGKDKVRIKVTATDSVQAGANTSGFITLWDTDFLQAKSDFPKFRALPFKTDPFTPGNFGKFALEYKPKSHRLDATIRVNFNFLDDAKKGVAKWNALSKQNFEQKFIHVVQNRWSNQFQFINVREPQSIWKKLNPVRVRVKVRKDTKAPHQSIDVHKKSVTAAVGVGGVRGKAEFGAGDDTAHKAFNPSTGIAELGVLAGLTPTPILFAAGKFDLPAADRTKLEFMATYLHRIKNPRFNISITGHHPTVVHAPKATNAQKNAANQQAKRLSQSRANEVLKVLKTGKATFHHLQSHGQGDKGAAAAPAWDKAEIASALPKGWQNVQTTLEHEAGHMLGIGDEYATGASIGTNTSHYALTMQAFGKQYADIQAKKVADSASLMNGGNDIRPHHYVTFWNGLSQQTAAAAFPKIPFVNADWKFKGV